MERFDINDFVNYCDIANEKLETRILTGNLMKYMTLFHGSDKDLKVISPTSINMGTRLSKQRMSSFWCRSPEYATLWALDWAAIYYGIPYFHDIDRRFFVVPEIYLKNKSTGEEGWAEEWILKYLDKYKLYIYKARIPIRDIGIGQLPINEFTVDKEIVPDKKIVLTRKDVEKFVKYIPQETFDKCKEIGYGSLRKSKTTFLEKILFRDPDKIMHERQKLLK